MNPSDIDQIHEMIFQLGLSTLLGAVLGIDRDLHRKPAGLRVLAMVALGACGVIMASITFDHSTGDGPLDSSDVKPETGVTEANRVVTFPAVGSESKESNA